MNSTTVLFYAVIAFLIISTIIVSILLVRTFAKSPTINLVQGRLKDEGDDIKDAMQYLKITNTEE